MNSNTITLDVRNEIREGREPFNRIMEAARNLRDGECLKVIAPFEPQPLIGVLAMQGFSAATTAIDDGFEVVFSQSADPGEGDTLL